MAEDLNWFKCDYCTFTTKDNRILKRHIVIHAEAQHSSLFLCEHCSFKAKVNSQLKRHIAAEHANEYDDINWIHCQQCFYKTIQKSNFDQHVLERHTNPEEIKWFKCVECTYKSKRNRDLKRHIMGKHSKGEQAKKAKLSRRRYTYVEEGRKRKVRKSKKITKMKENTMPLTSHKRKPKTLSVTCAINMLELHKCKICDFATNLKVDLTEHVRIIHEGKEENYELGNIFKCFYCKNCDFETHSTLVLTKHVNDCNIVTVRKQNELSSIQNDKSNEVISSGSFVCRQCAHESKSKAGLKTHVLLKHTEVKESVIRTTRKSVLRQHIVVRDPDPEDLNRSKDKRSLRRHIAVQYKSEDLTWFKCKHCSFKTKVNSYLNRHIAAKHVDPADINWNHCQQCSYKTIHKYNLEQHIQERHTNPEDIKWYKCDQCTYKSKRNADLKRHIMGKHSKGGKVGKK